jgi:3-hydroxyisobutyrate dehydrogenase
MELPSPHETPVGFIGIGVMGKSMAGHILAAGYPLHVFTRTASKAASLIEAGARWHDSPADLAASCRCVITMVGFPRDVEDVYLGPRGILCAARPGTVLIDMTTSDPSLAVRIEKEASDRGCFALDAPVSGGDIGAQRATLSIMAGGNREAFDAVLALLRVMGATIVYQGPAGSGQHTKLSNQIAIASTMTGVCEALAYARDAGLDPRAVLQSIAGGAAGSWTMSNLGPKMLSGDFSPGFFIKHFVKDLRLASESARRMGRAVPGLDCARSLYEELLTEGKGDLGTQALMSWYEKRP